MGLCRMRELLLFVLGAATCLRRAATRTRGQRI
jgi:hypothetical protein